MVIMLEKSLRAISLELNLSRIISSRHGLVAFDDTREDAIQKRRSTEDT